MAVTIAGLSATLVNISEGVTIGALLGTEIVQGLTIGSLAGGIALSATLSYASSLLIDTPSVKRSTQKQIFNQSVGPRLRYYGRVKVGGIARAVE